MARLQQSTTRHSDFDKLRQEIQSERVRSTPFCSAHPPPPARCPGPLARHVRVGLLMFLCHVAACTGTQNAQAIALGTHKVEVWNAQEEMMKAIATLEGLNRGQQ